MIRTLREARLDAKEVSVSVQIVAHWSCDECDVEGRDAATEPSCWNCGGPVTVTARPTVSDWHTRDDVAA
jgi:hypothetical protein